MATIKDVARDAGVAVGTVSKVLNGKYVSEKNRLKVQASVHKLNYQMDFYAKGMKMGNTRTIAVIIPEIRNPFFSQWVYELEKEISQRGYKLLLCQTEHNVEKEASYFRMAAQNKVDGIIGITYHNTDAYISGDFPFVSLDRHFSKAICCVASDNYEGGRIAAEKFISTGSTQLLYIRSGSLRTGETLKRWDGFKDECERHQMKAESLDLGSCTNGERERDVMGPVLYDFFKDHMIGKKLAYDGIFVSTDALALIVEEQLKKFNFAIPKDIQIIGYDGLTDFVSGKYILSTITQPVEKMAKTSVDLLIRQIKGEKVPELSILPVKFCDGGTTRSI